MLSEQDITQIKSILLDIDKKVTKEEPSFWAKYGQYIQYGLLGLGWVIGFLTRKYALFHVLSKIL